MKFHDFNTLFGLQRVKTEAHFFKFYHMLLFYSLFGSQKWVFHSIFFINNKNISEWNRNNIFLPTVAASLTNRSNRAQLGSRAMINYLLLSKLCCIIKFICFGFTWNFIRKVCLKCKSPWWWAYTKTIAATGQKKLIVWRVLLKKSTLWIDLIQTWKIFYSVKKFF